MNCEPLPFKSQRVSMKYFSKVLFFLSCVLVTLVGQAEPEKEGPWTLQDLLRFASENSFTIAKARQNKVNSELDEIKAKAKFWPSLQLSSSHGLRNQDPNPYTFNGYSSANLALSQNLWNRGIDATSLQLAKLGKRRAELQYFQQRDQLCLSLTQEFYRYSLLVKSLEIQKNQQKLLKRQLEMVSDEYLSGQRSRRDLLRFKSQSLRAELDIQKQITLIEKSRLSLMALAGLEKMSEKLRFIPEDSRPPLLDLFKNPAELNNTYEDQLIRLNSEGVDLQKELTLKGIGFTVSFDLKTSVASNDYWMTNKSLSTNEQKNWGAFLTFNWTLWDGGGISANQRQAVVQNEIQKIDLQQKKIDLQSEILKLQTQFLQLKQNFKTSEESLVLEQNNFLFIEGEYRQSRANYLDFISGVKDLADAQNRHWNNLYDLKQGIVLYHYYKGSLFRYLLSDHSEEENATEEI